MIRENMDKVMFRIEKLPHLSLKNEGIDCIFLESIHTKSTVSE